MLASYAPAEPRGAMPKRPTRDTAADRAKRMDRLSHLERLLGSWRLLLRHAQDDEDYQRVTVCQRQIESLESEIVQLRDVLANPPEPSP